MIKSSIEASRNISRTHFQNERDITKKLSSRTVIEQNKYSPQLSSAMISLSAEIAEVTSDELKSRFRNKTSSNRVDVRDRTVVGLILFLKNKVKH